MHTELWADMALSIHDFEYRSSDDQENLQNTNAIVKLSPFWHGNK